MKHITDFIIKQERPTAVTLGSFDGIHMGHRRLIALTKEWAEKENLQSVVFTFNPHPMFLFKKTDQFALILTREEKLCLMEELGIDLYIEYPFDFEVAGTAPEDFANMIFDELKCKVVIVGENYKFGYKNRGNAELLKKLGEERGVKVITVPMVVEGGERVSSTRIRECLVRRDLESANRLLTKPYFILGTVIEGKKLGRTIGFPTVNILADIKKLFPPNGVYATRTVYNGKIYYGVTNVGFNPTVQGKYKVVETFLFDFHQMVYGEQIKTFFYKGIRPEQKFESVEALRAQMNRDADSAREYFKTPEFGYWQEKY